MKYSLYPQVSNEEKIEIILYEYYDRYRQLFSVPLINVEIIKVSSGGNPCNPQNDGSGSEVCNPPYDTCCAITSSEIHSIVSPILVADDDVTGYTSSNQCRKEKLPWKRNYRLGYDVFPKVKEVDNCPPSMEIEFCRFLVCAFFTKEYQENPKNLNKLIRVIASSFQPEKSTLEEEDVQTLIKHLEHEEMSRDEGTWISLLDQTIMIFESRKQCGISYLVNLIPQIKK